MAKAIVAKVSSTMPIVGADKIHVAVILGEMCVVSKDVQEGYIGVLFPAEIVGFVNGKPIMGVHDLRALKNKEFTKKYGNSITYSYGCKEHEYKFHIYRLTYLTEDGVNVDFTQKQLESWCDDRNLPRTLEVAPPEIYDGDAERLMAKVEAITERHDYLSEDFTDPSHISEGVILRCDTGNMQPYFLKNKGYAFKVCEGIAECVDTEDAS